jgi:hypothetical protein
LRDPVGGGFSPPGRTRQGAVSSPTSPANGCINVRKARRAPCHLACSGPAPALRPRSSRRQRAPDDAVATVSRGGRPDLAGDALERVRAPVLLIVGGADAAVLDRNRSALARLTITKKLEIVSGATYLLEEPGALEAVVVLAATGFAAHCGRGHRHGGMLARDCRIASIQPGKAMSALVREHPARSCEDRSASIVLLARQSHPQPAAVASCPVAANRWITAASRCQHHSENPPRAGSRQHARLRSLTDIMASQTGALILRAAPASRRLRLCRAPSTPT